MTLHINYTQHKFRSAHQSVIMLSVIVPSVLLSIVKLNVVIQIVTMPKCGYADCHNAQMLLC